MVHSTLPKIFWGEVISTITYILNRVPTKAIDQTPYELWTSRKLDIGNLRKWGSVAHVLIPYQLRSKLDYKTNRCTLIGYPDKSKGWRFYHKDKRLIESKDVEFLEKIKEDDSTNDNLKIISLLMRLIQVQNL